MELCQLGKSHDLGPLGTRVPGPIYDLQSSPFFATDKLPVSPAYPACAELPAEDSKDRSLAPRQLLERVPPPVAFWTKPGCQSL
jgi:hypothetical protein